MKWRSLPIRYRLLRVMGLGVVLALHAGTALTFLQGRRGKKRLIVGLLFLVLGASEALLAQEGPVAPGTDVRLVLDSSRDLRGTLLGWGADTLRIQDPASGFVHLVPSLDVERLRVPEPRTRGRGALRGMLIGSIAGALTLGIVAVATPCDAFCFPTEEVFLLGAALGGATGGGIGAAAGAAWPGTRWVDVALRREELP